MSGCTLSSGASLKDFSAGCRGRHIASHPGVGRLECATAIPAHLEELCGAAMELARHQAAEEQDRT